MWLAHIPRRLSSFIRIDLKHGRSHGSVIIAGHLSFRPDDAAPSAAHSPRPASPNAGEGPGSADRQSTCLPVWHLQRAQSMALRAAPARWQRKTRHRFIPLDELSRQVDPLQEGKCNNQGPVIAFMLLHRRRRISTINLLHRTGQTHSNRAAFQDGWSSINTLRKPLALKLVSRSTQKDTKSSVGRPIICLLQEPLPAHHCADATRQSQERTVASVQSAGNLQKYGIQMVRLGTGYSADHACETGFMTENSGKLLVP